MLKHCPGSNTDLRGSVSRQGVVAGGHRKTKRMEQMKREHQVERRGSSVSLMCVVQDRDKDDPTDQEVAGKPFFLSSKYRQRLRKCSLTHSLDTPSCKNVESIRVYASCLRSDIEYKTVRISKTTTARQVISSLIKKFKMKHVDQRLFYLTLEVTLEDETNTVLKISDEDRLSEMLECNPWQDTKVRLCSKPGGFIRVYDTVLMPDSVYKSIRISGDTTVRDVIDIVLACCNSCLTPDQLCLVQTGPDTLHQTVGLSTTRRVMDRRECPLGVANQGMVDQAQCKFVLELKSNVETDQHLRKIKMTGDECFLKKVGLLSVSDNGSATSSSSNLTKQASLVSLDSLDSGYSGQSL